MKAYNLHAINDFKYEDVDKPCCGDDSVIINVKAAGICGSDIPRVFYSGTYHYPLIPGHEFAGEISVTGKNVDAKMIGKRVGIFPLIPCKNCSSCKKKQYEMCSNYSYLGSRTNGGFAEQVEVPVWNIIELPDSVSYEQAAMMEPMAVAVHAIRNAHIKKGDTVAICGLGTIGLFVTMFLAEMGVEKVYGIGNKDYQRNVFTNLGFSDEFYCDGKNENTKEWVLKKTDEIGVDIFFECVGKNDTFLLGIETVASRGRVQLVGNPSSDITIPKKIYWKILRKQLGVYGTWNSSFLKDSSDDWHYVLERLVDGSVHPEKMITHKFRLENLMQGFEIMRDKKEDYVKIMGII